MAAWLADRTAARSVGNAVVLTALAPGAATADRQVRISIASALQFTFVGLVIANLGRIPVLSTGDRTAPILINDLGLAMFLGLAAVALVTARSVRFDGVAMTGMAFLVVGGASTLLAIPRFGLDAFETFVSLAYLARWAFYFAIYIVVINCIRRDQVSRVWDSLEAGVLAFAIFGIVQSALLPDFAQLVYPESRAYLDWDPQGHRLVSTFLDPNFAGAFLLIALLVMGGRLAAGVDVSAWKPLLLLAAIVLTASRSTLVALLCGGLVILLVRGLSRRLIRILLLVFGALILALPRIIQFALSYNKLELDPSAIGRFVAWGRAVEALRDHPIIGVGFNTWAFVQRNYGWQRDEMAAYGTDGGLLFIALLTGIVGVTVFSYMLWRVVRQARTVWRDASVVPTDRGMAIGAAASVVAIVIHSLFTNSLLLPFLMHMLWVLWGLTAVLAHDAARARS